MVGPLLNYQLIVSKVIYYSGNYVDKIFQSQIYERIAKLQRSEILTLLLLKWLYHFASLINNIYLMVKPRLRMFTLPGVEISAIRLSRG